MRIFASCFWRKGVAEREEIGQEALAPPTVGASPSPTFLIGARMNHNYRILSLSLCSASARFRKGMSGIRITFGAWLVTGDIVSVAEVMATF